MTTAGHEKKAIKNYTRFVIRLLTDRKSGKISDSEWGDIIALPVHREMVINKDAGRREAESVARIIKSCMQTDSSEDEIIDLFCLVCIFPHISRAHADVSSLQSTKLPCSLRS